MRPIRVSFTKGLENRCLVYDREVYIPGARSKLLDLCSARNAKCCACSLIHRDLGSLGFSTARNSQSKLQSVETQQNQIQIKDGPKMILGEWVHCESPVILTGMVSGFYKFQTRAIDGAGENSHRIYEYCRAQ